MPRKFRLTDFPDFCAYAQTNSYMSGICAFCAKMPLPDRCQHEIEPRVSKFLSPRPQVQVVAFAAMRPPIWNAIAAFASVLSNRSTNWATG